VDGSLDVADVAETSVKVNLPGDWNTYPYHSVSASSCSDNSTTVPGAHSGDIVLVTPPADLRNSFDFQGATRVIATLLFASADKVYWRKCNTASYDADVPLGPWTVTVLDDGDDN
jgi:hypothetical protein